MFRDVGCLLKRFLFCNVDLHPFNTLIFDLPFIYLPYSYLSKDYVMNDRNRAASGFFNASYIYFLLFLKTILRNSLFVKSCVSLLLILLSCMASAAVTLTVPTTSTTGNYTVTWSGGQQTTDLFENGVIKATTSQSGSYSATGKASGTYSYYVRDCMTTGGCVNTSIQSTVVTLPTVPAAPPNVSASGSGTSAFISWTAPTGPVTSYNIQRLDGGLSTSTTATNYLDSTVNLATNYTYRVQACNTLGCSVSWTTSNVVNVSSVATSILTVPPSDDDGTYTITWSGARTFGELYESTGAMICSGGVSGGCTVSGKTAGTYSYYLKDCFQAPVSGSVKTCNSTPNQSVVVVPPPVPVIISAIQVNASVVVTWGVSTGAAKYELQRNNTTITSPTTTTYTDTGMSFGVLTTYKVRACKGTSCSAFATFAGLTVPPIPPVPNSMTAVVSGPSVPVTWGTSTDATSYELQRNSVSFNPNNTTITTTSLTDTTAIPGTPYIYGVRACNATGCSSPWKTSASITVPPIPATPATMSATVNLSSIFVQWSVSLGATQYQFDRSPVFNPSLTAENITLYTDTSVANGTSYTYSVRACNGTGCSAAKILPAKVAGAVVAGALVGEQYDYDPLGRLTKVKVEGAVKTDYQYDKAGNRTTVTE